MWIVFNFAGRDISKFREFILNGKRSWPSYMVMVLDSCWSHGFDPHTGHCSLLKLRQFHLPRFASVYSAANEYQHCWEGTCDGLASCPGESAQLHSRLFALNETRFRHWPSLAFMAYLRHTVWGMNLPTIYHTKSLWSCGTEYKKQNKIITFLPG